MVGDYLDAEQTARHQGKDNHKYSVHWFHHVAVKNRTKGLFYFSYKKIIPQSICCYVIFCNFLFNTYSENPELIDKLRYSVRLLAQGKMR